MIVQRFYVANVHDKWGPLNLNHKIWINDKELVDKWLVTLHYKINDELILFNDETERLYRIIQIEQPGSVQLELITEQSRKLSNSHIYLLLPLLKKENNLLIIRMAVELGVHNMIPILNERSAGILFDYEKTKEIVIKACEQSDRSDIPEIREEPIDLRTAIEEYSKLPLIVFGQWKESDTIDNNSLQFGILLSPEEGWSDSELELIQSSNLLKFNIDDILITTQIDALAKLINLISR